METEENPLVSVITPTYNAEAFIELTIDSVQSQTYRNWEMVIVDDASTDETVSIIRKIMQSEPRIRLIERKINEGAARTRNQGLREAKGRYIAFLDSDDSWSALKLERQLDFMVSNNHAFSYTGYNRLQVSEDGQSFLQSVEIPETATYHRLLKKNVIGCLTVMIDTYKTGPIQMVDMRRRQDYALWLELTRRGFTAYGLKEVLGVYRVRTDSISSNKFSVAMQNWRVYRDVEKLALPVAIWYFIHYAVLKTLEYKKY